MLRSASRRRRHNAGFTLVELMCVVVITGILGAVAVIMVRLHFLQAKANQALVGAQAIRVAEEAYRAQNGQYLDCSPGGADAELYPMEAPGKLKYEWRQPGHADYACWQQLGLVRTTGGTFFGYLVNAGRPGDTYPTLRTTIPATFPDPAPDVWYVIQFQGDLDGNGTPSHGAATSFSGDVYFEDELE